MTVVVTAAQRDALHADIVLAMTELSDISMLLNAGRGEEARGIWRRRLATEIRLLDDLGWEAQGTEDSYTLTLDRDELAAYARRGIADGEANLQSEAKTLAILNAGGDPWAK